MHDVIDDEDVADITALEWHILQEHQLDTKVPPVLISLKKDSLYIVGCLKVPKQSPVSFLHQMQGWYQDNRIAPWPDASEYYKAKREIEIANLQNGGVVFYTFREFFACQKRQSVPMELWGVEYARYIRGTRTAIDALIDLGMDVEIIRPDGSQMETIVIEEEIVEEDYSCENTIGIVSIYSHSPNITEAIDCLSLTVMTPEFQHIANIFFWPNSLLGMDATDVAIDAITSALQEYRVTQIYEVEKRQPFSGCPTGGITPFLGFAGQKI